MPTWITTKLLTYVSGGLALSLAVTAALLWSTSVQLDVAKDTIENRNDEIALLYSAIANRDAAIAKQNAAVAGLRDKADQDRREYLGRIHQAEQQALGYRQQADALLNVNLEATDEIERCRASVDLIHATLSQEL